jgi:hypothetical protein
MPAPDLLFIGGTFRDRSGAYWVVVARSVIMHGTALQEMVYCANCCKREGVTAHQQWFFGDGRWGHGRHSSIDLVERVPALERLR